MSHPIILIHGAWLTPSSLEGFRRRYEAAGHVVLVPPWPFHDRPVAALRQSPHPELRRLTVGAIAGHFASIVRAQPRPPILIGHSLGGLVVQMLLDRGLGAAGVAIAPAPARGIVPSFTALKAAAPNLMTWRGWNRVLSMPPARFARTFANTETAADQAAAFEEFVVPTAGRLYYQLAFGLGTGVDFRNGERAPLLLVAGGSDRTIEPSMVRANLARYRHVNAATDYVAFPDRSHRLIGARGWEEIADYVLTWSSAHARSGSAAKPQEVHAGATAT